MKQKIVMIIECEAVCGGYNRLLHITKGKANAHTFAKLNMLKH